MLNLAEPIQSDERLPQEVDVVIVGGGIIGCASAYYLARSGLKVLVVEKGAVAAEQSSRNWGWCRQGGRALAEVALAKLSLGLWKGLAAEMGRPTGFRQPGVLLVAKNQSEIAGWEAWNEHTRSLDMGCTVLSAKETRAKLPGCLTPFEGGLFSSVDGVAEPAIAAPAIAQAAREAGAVIMQQCAARGMETSGGHVSAVITEKGVVRTSTVLVAGGAWSSMFLAHHKITLPQSSALASVCRTSPISGITDGTGALGCDDFSLRQRLDGGVTLALRGIINVELTPQGLRYAKDFLPLYWKRRTVLKMGIGASFFRGPESMRSWKDDQPSPFEAMRILDPVPNMKPLERAFSNMKQAWPATRDARIVQSWAGMIDTTPDAVPVISDVGALPGLFLATGFSGHGFALGPGTGRLAADLVMGIKPSVDPTPFRYSRFFDGSKHSVETMV